MSWTEGFTEIRNVIDDAAEWLSQCTGAEKNENPECSLERSFERAENVVALDKALDPCTGPDAETYSMCTERSLLEKLNPMGGVAAEFDPDPERLQLAHFKVTELDTLARLDRAFSLIPKGKQTIYAQSFESLLESHPNLFQAVDLNKRMPHDDLLRSMEAREDLALCQNRPIVRAEKYNKPVMGPTMAAAGLGLMLFGGVPVARGIGAVAFVAGAVVTAYGFGELDAETKVYEISSGCEDLAEAYEAMLLGKEVVEEEEGSALLTDEPKGVKEVMSSADDLDFSRLPGE